MPFTHFHSSCIRLAVRTALALALAPACVRAPSAPPPAVSPPAIPTAQPVAASPAAQSVIASTGAQPLATAQDGTPPATAEAPVVAVQRDPHEFDPVQDPPQVVAVVARHPDPTRPDPLRGHFTLAQATADLPPGNDVVASIETSIGTFSCTLLTAEAPATVANFVGLARGIRPFWDPVAGRWTRRPFYDGSAFHRVIPEFMVQGGDILRSGRGGPGYEIRDENVASHDAAGQLCMANHGPNTGGAQFFITELPLPRLNGSYSVFGRCSPTDLVRRMARVPRSPHDQPITAIFIQHVTVHR